MARVTIEGTITPSTFLGTGKRITVDRTSYIDKLIKRGYVKVIESQTQDDVVAEIEEHTEKARRSADVENQLTGAPAKNALKEVWAEFLRERGIPLPVDATKNAMMDAWAAHREHVASQYRDDPS